MEEEEEGKEKGRKGERLETSTHTMLVKKTYVSDSSHLFQFVGQSELHSPSEPAAIITTNNIRGTTQARDTPTLSKRLRESSANLSRLSVLILFFRSAWFTETSQGWLCQ